MEIISSTKWETNNLVYLKLIWDPWFTKESLFFQ